MGEMLMTYEEIYSQKVVDKINDLAIDGFSPVSSINFIDKFGEDTFLEYYEDLIDFKEENPSIDVNILIEYYSGFDFLDDDFYGEFKSATEFASSFCYVDDISSYIVIDWIDTIQNLKEEFDFIPTKKQTVYIIRKSVSLEK